jgi:hypothetical protein
LTPPGNAGQREQPARRGSERGICAGPRRGGAVPGGTAAGVGLEEDVFPEYDLIPLKRFTDRVEDDLDEWIYAFKHTEVPDEFHSYKIDALKEKLAPLKMDATARGYTAGTQDAPTSRACQCTALPCFCRRLLSLPGRQHTRTRQSGTFPPC